MNNFEPITAAFVRERFSYDPDTGVLRHTYPERIRSLRADKRDGRIGARDRQGHLRMGILGRSYLVHRVVWLWQTGAWPEGVIDHIDGVKDNNRWKNLRDVSPGVNSRAERRPAKGRTLPLGVYLCPRQDIRPFYASIKLPNGVCVRLGDFDTVEQASAAYNAARAITRTPLPYPYMEAEIRSLIPVRSRRPRVARDVPVAKFLSKRDNIEKPVPRKKHVRRNHPQTPLLDLLRKMENDETRNLFAKLCGTSRGYLYQLSICGRRSCRVDLAQRIADASVKMNATHGTPIITVQALATMCANVEKSDIR